MCRVIFRQIKILGKIIPVIPNPERIGDLSVR